MCFHHVLFFNLVCFSILSYCTTAKQLCDYDQAKEPEVFMKISGKSASGSPIEDICITTKSKKKTIAFRQKDAMELRCIRVLASASDKHAISLNTAAVLLQWKLRQFDHDLLVVAEEKPIKNGNVSIRLKLDRYDDGLTINCSSNGNETRKSIYVKFVYNGEKNVTDINEANEDVKVTEGEIVGNKFASSVILYNDIKGDPRVISQNDNIFDSVTLEDNGTLYAVWAENKNIDLQKQLITNFVKMKWVVYVQPASSHLLFLLGIGGISCIVIVIIVVYCKYCRKKKENSIENPYAEVYEVAHVQPNQYQVNHLSSAPEERDYAQIPSQNDRVVYATIDVRETDITTPMQDNEPYARIIGVIRREKNRRNVKMFKIYDCKNIG